jgi:beta-lactamase regulating signal transducer with metallopeptidase domain
MVSSVVGLWSSWVVAVTWQLAALALIAVVCEKVLRLRQPRVRHALWWFVLAAPLLLAPGRMALERMEAVVRVAPPVAVQAVTRVHVPVVVPVERVVPQAAAPVPEVAWWSRVRAMDVLGLAWVMGCLTLVARLVVGHARARRLVSESRAVDDEQAGAALAELCAEAGVRQEVGLRVSSSLGAPVLYGVRRPTILLPEDWVESLEADDLRALLAHEVAHVRRGDCLANLIQRIVEIPAFFHPGVWLASRQITLAREELADGCALARGVEASSYARSLTAAAERAQVRVSVASVGVAEGRSTLLRRVEAIMRGGSLKRMSRPLVVALIGAALVSAGAFAAVQLRGEAKPTVMPPIPQGIHLTYRVTSQRLALPPEWIEQTIAAAVKDQDAGLEQRLQYYRSRAEDGPEETDTGEYWGTMHGFMYALADGYCVAYDGKKTADGSALYMVPHLIKQPTAMRSGMSIAEGTLIIDDLVSYLGIYQPGKELFDEEIVLSETVRLATGERRLYHLPHGRRTYALEYDEEGRVRKLTITYDKGAALVEEYQFADHATVGGVTYPRELRRKQMIFYLDGDGRMVQAVNKLSVWRVTNASAGPIPNSFFALSTARPGAQVEDGRYQVPGNSEPGITYTYRDPALLSLA